jgi:hypothetical protein
MEWPVDALKRMARTGKIETRNYYCGTIKVDCVECPFDPQLKGDCFRAWRDDELNPIVIRMTALLELHMRGEI